MTLQLQVEGSSSILPFSFHWNVLSSFPSDFQNFILCWTYFKLSSFTLSKQANAYFFKQIRVDKVFSIRSYASFNPSISWNGHWYKYNMITSWEWMRRYLDQILQDAKKRSDQPKTEVFWFFQTLNQSMNSCSLINAMVAKKRADQPKRGGDVASSHCGSVVSTTSRPTPPH